MVLHHQRLIRRFDRLSLGEIQKVKELPKVIAIDEYKGDTREGKYQLIIANGETKEPIDILPNRIKETIKALSPTTWSKCGNCHHGYESIF